MRFQRQQDEQEAGPAKIRVGCATGVGEDSFRTGANAARRRLGQVGDEPLSAVIVFAPVSYDLDQLLAGVHEVVGEVPVFGATSGGEICNGVHENSVAVTVLASPFLKVRLGLGERVSEDWQQAVRRAVANDELRPFFSPDDNTIWGELIHQGKSAFAMLFSPGSTQAADSRGHEILEELKRLSLGRLPVFGRIGRGLVDEGELRLRRHAGVARQHDCSRIRDQPAIRHRHLARSEADRRAPPSSLAPADMRFSNWTARRRPKPTAGCAGIPRSSLEKQDLPLIAGQPLGIRDSVGQYTVNMISCITPQGAMRLAQPVSEGTTLTLMNLVPDEMIAAGEDAMRKAILRSSECDPAVTFTCDCVLRPLILEERAGEEVAAILRMTPNAPLVGFLLLRRERRERRRGQPAQQRGHQHAAARSRVVLCGHGCPRELAAHRGVGRGQPGPGGLGARGHGGQPRQERVPRAHEPRNPHALERHHRHDRTGPGHRSRR